MYIYVCIMVGYLSGKTDTSLCVVKHSICVYICMYMMVGYL